MIDFGGNFDMNKKRGVILLSYDVTIVILSYILAIGLRYDFRFTQALQHPGFLNALPFVGLVYLIVFLLYKTYRTVWERVSIEEGFRIAMANATASIIVWIVVILNPVRLMPLSVIFVAFFLNTLFQEATRFSYRYYRVKRITNNRSKQKNLKRVLIYGAGNSGSFIAKEISTSRDYNYFLIGFIDDNPLLKGTYVSNHIVFGDKSMLDKVINQHVVDEIIVAMPNQSVSEQQKVKQLVYKYGLPIHSISSSKTLFVGMDLKKTLKKVDILDLLQRKEIVLNDSKVRASIVGKTVLVTGAAGSIGSELVRQILGFNPRKIVLLDLNENALYALQMELVNQIRNELINPNIELVFLIASIRDKRRIEEIFNHHKFDLVFHAAAHKHVPLMEESPKEAIKNNILGTKNLIDASNKHNVGKFINISTDKAVNPTNVMGATKRFNEMLLQSQNSKSNTKFMAVRFGNVLGSNGSVVPHFTKQIAAGGPVTVTHKDITRYFMTIPEAVSLVLQAETYAEGGEIFVLNMGDPVKIVDLAEQMIKLSGFTPYKDIQIEFTGLRPGEKLFEELLMDEEGLTETENELIFIAKPILIPVDELNKHISNFESVLINDYSKEKILEVIKSAVPTYNKLD